MAEEAIGLAKSLNWTVEWGPNYLIHPAEIQEEAVSSVELLPKQGRALDNENNISVEGEKLKNWDKVEVYGTGMTGYFMNGTMLIDLDEMADEEEDKEFEDDNGDEWTNPELRQNIAVSSMLKIRSQGSPVFFGSGKVKI